MKIPTGLGIWARTHRQEGLQQEQGYHLSDTHFRSRPEESAGQVSLRQALEDIIQGATMVVLPSRLGVKNPQWSMCITQSILHDQSAKPSEVRWGIQSCPLQTASVLTHLTFLSAQVREMIASSALKKGNHFPWSEAQKVEQLSQICNFWAGFPLNLCPICFFLMRSLALSQYWNKIPKIPVLPHRISHSAKMATESWNNSSMRMDIYTYTYSLWYFICYICSIKFFVCIYVYIHVTIHTICVLCKFKSMGWKGINPSSFLFFCETWTPSGYNL